MHRGFNLTLSERTNTSEYQDYFQIGREIYQSNKRQVNNTLLEFMRPNGVLDGSRMKDDWFPMIKADVFISHSHKDEKAAIAISGWLKSRFNLVRVCGFFVSGEMYEDLLWQLDRSAIV